MKILMISSYLPYPLYSGGQVRLFNIIKELSKRHEITLVCERRPNETEDDIKEVENICSEVITVPRKKQWSIENVLKAGTSKHSFLHTGHTLPEMQKAIQDLLGKKSFDVIHVETFYVMQNVPPTKIPVILVEHNIEYKVYERFKDRAPLFVKPFLSIDISKIKNEEEYFWKKAAQVAAVSKEDQTVIASLGNDATVVSNGVDVEKFSMKDLQKSLGKKEKKILFIGDYKWLQNRDCATFIIKEIWPELKKEMEKQNITDHIKLWFVARNIPENIKSLIDDPDVLFDEESSAKETQEIFQEAAVLLAPIRIGGGTSYKIIESMSCGTPVVTMPLSADALEAKDSKELLVGETATELAQITLEILRNTALYQSISRESRIFVQQKYTWKEITKVLEDVYKKSLEK